MYIFKIFCYNLYFTKESNAYAVAYITVMSKVPLPGLSNEKQSKMSDPLPKGKNPFNNRGDWTPEQLKQLNITVADLRETTSDFTRKRNPGHRYWKGQIIFKFDGFESRILKMNNCAVPYNKNATYGKDFIYANLQKPVADAIVAACAREEIIATHHDNKLSGTDQDWWATINGTDGRLGTVDQSGDFDPKDMKTVFDRSENGALFNFDLVFSIRLTIEGGRERRPNDSFRIVTDCSRGAVKAINQSIPPPFVESQIPQQKATRTDVASQELLDAIGALSV